MSSFIGRIKAGRFKVNVEDKPSKSVEFPLELRISVLAGRTALHKFEIGNRRAFAAIDILQHGVSIAGSRAVG